MDDWFDERLGSLIVDGLRHEVWVRSAPDEDGTWHNALIFRRDGKFTHPGAPLAADVSWHVPPGFALVRARKLDEREQIALFQRARRSRPPLL